MARAGAKSGGRNGATEMLRAVGKKLRLRRIERGLTLQAASKRTGVSAAMLSLVERGKATPSVGTLVAINSLLNLHIPELLGTATGNQDLVTPVGKQTVVKPLRGVTHRVIADARLANDVESIFARQRQQRRTDHPYGVRIWSAARRRA